MNATAQHLLNQHDGLSCTALPGRGFDNLTTATACTYLLDSDQRILSVILETDADEPLDEVCDFFVQQIVLSGRPSDSMQQMGVRRAYGDLLVVRLALDGVPDWQRDVIQQRIGESITVVGATQSTWSEDDEDA